MDLEEEENNPGLPAPTNTTNIVQSTIGEARITGEETIVTGCRIDALNNAAETLRIEGSQIGQVRGIQAESVNIEGGQINQVSVTTSETNFVGASIGTVIVQAQGGGGAQALPIEDDSAVPGKRIKLETVSSKRTQKICEDRLGKQNCNINRIRRDTESSKGELFSDMGCSDTSGYYEMAEQDVVSEYLLERALASRKPSTKSFKPTSYANFKDLVKEAKGKRYGVVGPAGSGKSTLLERLERDLSQKKEKLPVFLNFHHIGDEQKITPCELFFGGAFRDDEVQDCYEWLLENQDKIIFILDGLDQASWGLKDKSKYVGDYGKGSTSEIISDLLSKNLFPDVTVVFSSREYAVSSLKGSLRPDKVISIIGLSAANVEYLFTKEFGEKGQRLWDKMEETLKPLLSVPAFLKFTIYIYEVDPDIPPTTLTEIMQKLFSSFVHSEHKQDELTEDEITGLRRLSYEGLKEKKVTFKSRNFIKVGLKLNQLKDFVIIVPGLGRKNYCLLETDKVVFFSHQTFQEFFSSENIIYMDVESFRKTVEEDLSDDYWIVVTRFVTGLLLNKKSKPEEIEISDLTMKQDILKRMLALKYGEGKARGSKVASTVSTLASIAETEDRVFIQSFVEEISFHHYPIGISGMSSIASVVRHCVHLKKLQLSDCSLDVDKVKLLWKTVKHSSVKVKTLKVSSNHQLGDGFEYICRLAAHCDVQELDASFCKLQSNQLSWLNEMKPSQLNLLNLFNNKLSDTSIIDISRVIADDGVLNMLLTPANMGSELQLLEKELGTKKLRGLHLQNDMAVLGFLGSKKQLSLTDSSFASIGNIISDGGELYLYDILVTSSGLKNLMSALDKKKLRDLQLQNDSVILDRPTEERPLLSDSSFASIGNIITDGGELGFMGFSATSSGLSNLKLALDKKKISKLYSPWNTFDADCCEIIANIVMQCSVDKLTMLQCGITDDALNRFLSITKGVKINKLDVRCNHLSPAAIESIRESITVEDLDADDQSGADFDSSDSDDVDDQSDADSDSSDSDD